MQATYSFPLLSCSPQLIQDKGIQLMQYREYREYSFPEHETGAEWTGRSQGGCPAYLCEVMLSNLW